MRSSTELPATEATEARAGAAPSPGDAGADGADHVKQQAARLERLLPTIARLLFVVDRDDPLSDLPLGQFKLCALLHREGKRTMSQIGEELDISVSAVTQMADRLERAGMVERMTEPDGDRRTRYLRLTPHGSGLMNIRVAQRTARAEEALGQLDPDAREEVLNSLETLLAVCRTLRPGRSVAEPQQER